MGKLRVLVLRVEVGYESGWHHKYVLLDRKAPRPDQAYLAHLARVAAELPLLAKAAVAFEAMGRLERAECLDMVPELLAYEPGGKPEIYGTYYSAILAALPGGEFAVAGSKHLIGPLCPGARSVFYALLGALEREYGDGAWDVRRVGPLKLSAKPVRLEVEIDATRLHRLIYGTG